MIAGALTTAKAAHFLTSEVVTLNDLALVKLASVTYVNTSTRRRSMRDGLLIQVTTQLVDPGHLRRDHFAVACSDMAQAFELVRAERLVTDDQRLSGAGAIPGAFLAAICMLPDEVRSLGCGAEERYPCRIAEHGLARAPLLLAEAACS